MMHLLTMGHRRLRQLLQLGTLLSISIAACASENDNTQAATNTGLSTLKVVLWHRNYDAPQTYNLLRLALEKTAEDAGPFEIVRGEEITQGRALAALVQDKREMLTVINAVIDDEREASLLPVRVITDEGLIGYRVCIIRRDDQPLFDNIRSHEDLARAQITFGQGAHWPDTRILRENALNVVTSVDYDSLFDMLLARRFHCFLRGANEAVDDLRRHPDPSLMIEPNLAFVYPSASVFMVNRNNSELAARIELGLRRAMLDGSFADYFHAMYDQPLEQLNIRQRRIFRLNNPFISDEFLRKSTARKILRDSKFMP